MNGLSKKVLSIILSMLMVGTALPTFTVAASADDGWTIASSSNFDNAGWSEIRGWSWNPCFNATPETSGGGSTLNWDVVQWWAWDDIRFDTTHTKVERGYLHHSSNNSTPVTGAEAFKIDLSFSFYNSEYVKDDASCTINSSQVANLLKLATDVDGTNFSARESGYVFKQNAYGDMSANSGTDYISSNSGSMYAVDPSNPLLSKNTEYHYVLTYKNGAFNAELTDSSGSRIINYGTLVADVDTSAIKSVILGMSTGDVRYEDDDPCRHNMLDIQYHNIKFYTGENDESVEPVEDTNDHYLFAYFTGNNNVTTTSTDNQAIRFAGSADGVTFSNINSGNTVVTQTMGTRNCRDPYIFKGQDEYYYLIATDMDASTGVWWGNSNSMVLWRSKDLLHWQDETIINMNDIIGRGNIVMRCWAPQVIWDSIEEKYMVYFGLGTSDDYTSNTDMVYCYTNNLLDQNSYTRPSLLYHSPANKDSIDGDITCYDGKYYMFYKDESKATICVVTSDSVSSGFDESDVVTLDTYFNDGRAEGLEGCQVYKEADGDYIFIADRFGANGVFAAFNFGDDLEDTIAKIKNGKSVMDYYDSSLTSQFSAFHPRHGSVINITESQYNRLTSGHFSQDALARYLVGSDLTRDYMSGSYNLTNNGATWNTSEYDGQGAAYFNGDADGNTHNNLSTDALDTMLTNAQVNSSDGLTVSFYAKPTDSPAQGRFFELNNTGARSHEWNGSSPATYFSMWNSSNSSDSGRVEVAASREGGNFSSEKLSNTYNNEWKLYTATFTGSTVRVYVNGALAYSFSTDKISDAITAFKSNGYLVLGDTTWIPDKSYKGYIRDFRIYKGAMSIDTILRLYGYDEAAEIAGDVISRFETMMSSGNVYTNMLPAYEAYINLCETKDAYEYGKDSSADLEAAASALSDAISDMSIWNVYTGTKEAKIVNSTATGAYSNILYCSATTDFTGGNSIGDLHYKIFIPHIVVMYYDGTATNSSYPVGWEMWDYHNGTNRKLNYVYPVGTGVNQSGQPTGSNGDPDADFEFRQAWNGYRQGWTDPLPWNEVFQNANHFGYFRYDGDSGTQSPEKGDYNSDGPHRFYGNRMYYKGSGALNNKTPLRFELYQSDNNSCDYVEIGARAYVVDYNALKTAIVDNKSKFASVASYKEGGLKNVLAAYDYATQENAGDWFNDCNDDGVQTEYDRVSAFITNAASAITNCGTPVTDNASAPTQSDYATMRTRLTESRTISGNTFSVLNAYNDGVNNGFKQSQYNTFKAAYEAARDMMATLDDSDNTGYAHHSNVTTLASNLHTAFEALEYAVTAAPSVTGAEYLGANDGFVITNNDAEAASEVYYSIKYDTGSFSSPILTEASYNGGTVTIKPFSGDNAGKRTAVIRAYCTNSDGTKYAADETYRNLTKPSLNHDSLLYAGDDGTVTITASNVSGGQLQYKIDNGSWTNYSAPFKPFELSGYDDELELTISARQIMSYGGGVTSTSDVVSYTYTKAEDFSIYSVTGETQDQEYYSTDSTRFVINDAAKYSSKDKIIYYLYIDGNLEGGITPVDYDAPITITQEMKEASCVRIQAFLKTNEAIYTYADKTLINESTYNSFIYQESFNGSISGATYSKCGTRSYNATLAGENTARIDEVKGSFDGNNNSADLRRNVLYIKGGNMPGNKVTVNTNPLATSANRSISRVNGVTISFWRQLYTTGDNPTVTDFGSGHNDEGAVVFEDRTDSGHRNRYLRIDLDGDLSFVLGNGSNFIDYKTAVNDNTGHDTPSTRGNWVNFVLTVNPNGEITMYVNGVPHALSYGNKEGALKDAANSSNTAYIASQIIDFITDSNTDITYSNGVGWQNIHYDLAIDDVRIYNEVKTQVDIQNMYGDSASDTPSGVASTHDPTNVACYTLAKNVTYTYDEATYTLNANSTVGKELIDYVNNDGDDSNNIDVLDSNDVSDTDYYSFGTGMTVYHSDDAVRWTVVGDSEGRCGYQNSELFVTNDGNAADYTSVLSEPLNFVCKNTPDASTGAGYLMWAPHVMYNIKERAWMMYCSTSTWGSKRSAIFAAKSTDGIEGHYKYSGLICKSYNNENEEKDGSDYPNSIDPCVYYSAGCENLYIVYGSWGWNTNSSCVNFKELELDGTSEDPDEVGTEVVNGMIDDEGAGGSGNSGEGAYVVRRTSLLGNYYYIYVTYGQNNGNYTERVYRSSDPTTSYVGVNGLSAKDTSTGTIHGNSILSPYYITANDYIYTSVGHNSVYDVANAYGQLVSLNAAHTREFSTEQSGFKALEEKALATRQTDLNGNIMLQNMIVYTDNDWPVALPLPYDGTDTTLYKGACTKSGDLTFNAYDIEGIYGGNMLMTRADYSYSGVDGETIFNVVPTDDTNGVIINTNNQQSYIFVLSYGDQDDDSHNDITYITLKNPSTKEIVGHGVLANQGIAGAAKTEFSVMLNTGQYMWGVWKKEYPHDAESAGDMVELDSVVYTHKADDSYAMYGQEISDDETYLTGSQNGERATTIKVKYPYYINTSDATSITCINDKDFVSDGYSGGTYRAVLIGYRDVNGDAISQSEYTDDCYAYYKLTGSVSNYFAYGNGDDGKYPETGLQLLIQYTDGTNTYGEYEFPFVMPNPAIAHTIQGIRNQNNGGGTNRKAGQLLFDRFIGSSGNASSVLSTVTKERNTSGGSSSTGDPKQFGTGVFNYLDNWGNTESLEATYNSPQSMANKFRFLNAADGVNSGSYGMIEHSNTSEFSYTVSSNVVDTDYYVDYSDSENYIANNPRGLITTRTDGSRLVPTGYSFDFRTSNIKWVGDDEQKSRYGTTSYVLTTGDAKSNLTMDSTYDGHKDSFAIGRETNNDDSTFYTFGNYYKSGTERPTNYPGAIFRIGSNAYDESDGVLENVYVNDDLQERNCREWSEFFLHGAKGYDNKYSIAFNDENGGRAVMCGYLSDPTAYDIMLAQRGLSNSDFYTVGLTRALPLVNTGRADTNAWNMHITFTGNKSVNKNTDTSTAEKYANFILEQGIITRISDYAIAEENYAYYNLGVHTCDKGAVREFVDTWANKEMNINRDGNGRISTISSKVVDGSTDIKSGNYSIKSYNAYLEKVAEAYWFVNNPKNTTYVSDEDSNRYEYSTAYGSTPGGDTHALIYADEDGDSIFGSSDKLANTYSATSSARTDEVQADIIADVVDAYDSLFSVTDYSEAAEDYGCIEITTTTTENDTINIYASSSREGEPVKTYSKAEFTTDSWNAFVNLVSNVSGYYSYTTDEAQRYNTTDYWRYITLSAKSYQELSDIISVADSGLMPKIDTSSLSPLAVSKRTTVGGGIFANGDTVIGERAFADGEQVYTYSSWSTMNEETSEAETLLGSLNTTTTYRASDGTNKTFTDGMYKVNGVTKYSFGDVTYYAQNFDYVDGNVTQALYDANENDEQSIVSAKQKAVYDEYNVLDDTSLSIVDEVSRYEAFDSANAVLYSIDTNKYTDEGKALIIEAKNEHTQVYKKLATGDSSMVLSYNSATNGKDMSNGDVIKLTSVGTTDAHTSVILSLLTTLESSYVRQFVGTMTVSVDGSTDGITQPESQVKKYGEVFSFDISAYISEDDAVIYGVSYYADEAANISEGTIDSVGNNPTGSTKNKIFNRAPSFVADQNMAITADITKASSGEYTTEVQIYNGFNQLQQIAYVGDISSTYSNGGTYSGSTIDGKANSIVIDSITVSPKVIPFYSFNHWKVTVSGKVYKFVPVYDVEGSVNLTVRGGTATAINSVSYDKKVTVTVNSAYDNADFVAWTARKGSKYQIVSYDKSFSFYTVTNETFEPLIKAGESYKLPVSDVTVTYDDFDFITSIDSAPVSSTDSGLTEEAVFKSKLENKYPFISVIAVKSGTSGGKYFNRAYLRITSGASVTQTNAGSVFKMSGRTVEYNASSITETNQTIITVSSSKTNMSAGTHKGFIDYSYTFSSKTFNLRDTTAEYGSEA